MQQPKHSTEDLFVRNFGQTLIPQLYLCLRNAQLYEPKHAIYQEGIDSFLNILQNFFHSEQNLSLHIVREYFFLNDVRLKVNVGGYHIYRGLLDYLQQRELGLLVIDSSISKTHLEMFFQIVARVDLRSEQPFEMIQQSLTQRVQNITVAVLETLDISQEIDLASINIDSRELAITTYFKATEILKDVYANVRQNKMFDIRKVKHIVHAMVDFVLEGEYTLLAMTQIKDYPHILLNHPVNVCVLSIAVGNELGLKKKEIADLGFCAFLHDVGMVKLPRSILGKLGKRMTLAEQKLMSRHTIYGAQILLKTKKQTDVMIRGILVCFQHHAGDLYSKIVHKGNIDLFSKIVCIASAFNTLTTSQDGRPPMQPEVALNTLMEESGEFYDPVLIKIFINTIGKYPVGSMVKLSTGEVGIVLKPNPSPKFLERPVLKLISDAMGNSLDNIVVDLMEKEGNRYQRTIVELIDTTDFELEVNDYITII